MVNMEVVPLLGKIALFRAIIKSSKPKGQEESKLGLIVKRQLLSNRTDEANSLTDKTPLL